MQILLSGARPFPSVLGDQVRYQTSLVSIPLIVDASCFSRSIRLAFCRCTFIFLCVIVENLIGAIVPAACERGVVSVEGPTPERGVWKGRVVSQEPFWNLPANSFFTSNTHIRCYDKFRIYRDMLQEVFTDVNGRYVMDEVVSSRLKFEAFRGFIGVL